MAKDKNNAKQELGLSLVTAKWRSLGGGTKLELTFAARVPNTLQSEKGVIKGDVHNQPFSVDLAEHGTTVVSVPILTVAEQPRLNATLEIGGQSTTFTKDVPYEAPTDGVAVDLLTQVYKAELAGAKVLMLAVGVQLTSRTLGLPARDVTITVGQMPEQTVQTDSRGRAEVYFGPISEESSYDVSITSLGVTKRTQRILIPRQRPPMKYDFNDVKAVDGSGFTVSCSIWNSVTGESVDGHKVTVRVGNQHALTGITTNGFVSIGPFVFERQSRLTTYTVYVEGFPPKKGTIKNPPLVENPTA